MRKIVIAEHSGFCFGVKRAMNMISDVSTEYKNMPICTLGPIIHNPQAVEKLRNSGINVIENINEIDKGVIILRTHGVEKNLMHKLENKEITVIDATCPFVRRAQEYVVKLHKEGYPVFVIGEKNHPEVKALKSQAKNNVTVIQNESDLKNIEKSKNTKIGVISQTTQDLAHYKEMVMMIFDYYKEIRIFNTICNATSQIQKSAVELAKKVDVMFIIGGYNSANTKRLYELCKRIHSRTYHIETEKNIDVSIISDSTKVIGIAAGASTPDWIIENVKNYLKKI